MELYWQSARVLRELLEKKEISAFELVSSVLDRIGAVGGKTGAYITVTGKKARERARRIDEIIARGEPLPPLAGIPVAVKDNICTKGVLTTAGSKMLADFVPPYNATVVERLEAAGAVITGKTNMDEFAMGSSTENSAFFPTRNPWDLNRVPGGSSGGSAAAVASGEAVLALGSDTGGSIRQPASFCGVVGLKPTYGAVSRYGLIAFASSLDQIGPLARNVYDCALLQGVIAGHDPRDSTSARFDVPGYTQCLEEDVRGLRLGVPREYMSEGIEEGVREAVETAMRRFEDLGASVEYTSLPHTKYSLPAYYLIAPAEASSNLARYDGVRYGYRAPDAEDVVDMFKKTRSRGFGPEVKRRIMLGTYALSAGYYDAYYLKALKVRTLIVRDFERAFEKYDLLLSPTSPTVAFGFGERTGDPLKMYLSDICTMSVNLAGLPAISLPCGFAGGLPVGLQLIARPFDEANLLRAAYTYEQATGHCRRFPAGL